MYVSMPELDGFQLADMIREHPRFQETAIIFISAVHLTDLDRLKGFQRGAVDYISVPVVPDLLRARVSVFSELHRKTRQLESLNQELRRLSYSLMTAQDEERRRIARELHDGLGQDLTAAKMVLGAAIQPSQSLDNKHRAIADALSVIDTAMEQIRTMSYLLHPPLLDEMGLLSALRWYTDGFAKSSSLRTVLYTPDTFPRLEPELEITIFKIVQEALTNVFRHADAKLAIVRLEESDGIVSVSIKDDGKGIGSVPGDMHPSKYGIGLIGIKQRVEERDGRLTLRNTGAGTLVEASIPLRVVQTAPKPLRFPKAIGSAL